MNLRVFQAYVGPNGNSIFAENTQSTANRSYSVSIFFGPPLKKVFCRKTLPSLRDCLEKKLLEMGKDVSKYAEDSDSAPNSKIMHK